MRKRSGTRVFPHTPKHRDSALTHGEDTLQGFLNLTFLLLVSATLQLMAKNYFEYGLFIDFSFASCIWGDLYGATVVISLMNLYAFTIVVLVKARVRDVLGDYPGWFLYAVAQFILYAAPIRIIYARQMAPLMAAAVTLVMVIISLKIHSYYSTNVILLKLLRRGKSRDPRFPGNVGIVDFVYFLAAPTLVYETYYPRNESIRWMFLLKELVQCAVCISLAQLVCAQFIMSILADVENSKGLVHDVLRLSIPSIITWLLGFYSFFHCWLNCVAEVTRFADREFYRDWWNATSLDVFWRKWNILVHEWLLRHVYLESVRTAKHSPMLATLWTFLFSAIYHELVFFVAFRVLRPWFFLAMFLQIPMILVSRWIYQEMNPSYRDFVGNINVWMGFFVGQPLILILYIRTWFFQHPSLSCMSPDMAVSWFEFF